VHLANWFDANIQDIDAGQLDDWGYAERPIRGGTELSNHASGTAIDINATKWPLGADPRINLSQAKIEAIRQHLRIYEGCIRWGGDYRGRKDPMHFEIVLNEDACDRIARKLSTRRILRKGNTGPDVEELQRRLRVEATGSFGPVTERFVKELQKDHGLVVDGIVGPDTYRALGMR
jgi:hypothetical protein